MKKFMETIPFVLLFGLVLHSILNTPNISQAIIIVALSGLCGYRLFAMEQEKPDLVKVFQEQFNAYQKRHEQALVHLENKVKELDSNYGKSTMNQARNNKSMKFEF